MKVVVTPAGSYDLTKMNREQYIKFRYMFIECRMHHPVWSTNSNQKAMDLILNAITLIMCKKVPVDIGVMKID
jgi:hypothetical protein